MILDIIGVDLFRWMLVYKGFFVFLNSFVGLIKFILNYYHFLISLLALEFISLGLCVIVLFCGVNYFSERYYLLYFLVMVVAEAVIGLSILVSVSFYFRVDYIKSFNVLLC